MNYCLLVIGPENLYAQAGADPRLVKRGRGTLLFNISTKDFTYKLSNFSQKKFLLEEVMAYVK